jgi:hypothetical protein
MSIISAFRGLRQEDLDFKVSFSYKVKPISGLNKEEEEEIALLLFQNLEDSVLEPFPRSYP